MNYITRSLLGVSLASALSLASSGVAAGDRWHGYRPPYPGHHPGHHGRDYRHHYHHHVHHYRHRHRDRDDDEAAYFVGGLLLGGLLTHAYHSSRPAYPATYASPTYRTAAPAYQPATYASEPAPARRLFRDVEGRCFERSYDASGREVRMELPPGACDW